MEKVNKLSILYPYEDITEYKVLSDGAWHDLGFDAIVKKITADEKEQTLIKLVMTRMNSDARLTKYRCDVFADIYAQPELRTQMVKILDRMKFLQDFGSIRRGYEEAEGAWELLHRLAEIKDYISCVETLYKCLSDAEIKSEGLISLKNQINQIYYDSGFAELKKDIEGLNATTDNLKSVTVGINLNSRFEASEIGLVSVNSKSFTRPGIIKNFYNSLATKEGINTSEEWRNDYTFRPAEGVFDRINPLEKAAEVATAMANPIISYSLLNVAADDANRDIMHHMDKAANNMLSAVVKRLRDVLSKYVTVTIRDITDLMPEFIYYIRWAEYIEKLLRRGMKFCRVRVSGAKHIMNAKGLYNLKLAASQEDADIVKNDLTFGEKERVYILTGANRGGKTTITQAVGMLFVMAQGGLFVPCEAFEMSPVDCIYTHFPADEDKTMDLGRLGEECTRFKSIFEDCSTDSLLLLNETFSTTAFDEGYYIARDAVRALLSKGTRTIYNTHMHKLASDLDEINTPSVPAKAVSLVVLSDGGKRSFKVAVAPPQGLSFARDIAEKYGVTYEMLTNK